MDPLVTLLLSDGRPGHSNLSEGICAAIARLRPLDIVRIDVRRPRWIPARVLSAMTNAGERFAQPVASLMGIPNWIQDCDLIVSAGGDTLAASVSLAKTHRCPNIFYGSLRRYRPADFALVLTSYAANATRPNHAMAMKPSAFDSDAMPVRSRGADSRPVMGLLIGGDSGTVRFSADDWSQLSALLVAVAANGQRVIVSNSRRTPASVSDSVRQLASSSGGAVTFIDVRQAGNGTLASLFAACDQVAVTVDSSSMISEAVWARKPVVVLEPQIAQLPALEHSYRAYLTNGGWITMLPLGHATPMALETQFRAASPLKTNPLDDLAALLQARLPALFK